MTTKEDIQKKIDKLSGKYSPYQIFYDWVKMLALAIQNGCDIFHGEEWEKREKQYMEIAAKYTKDEMMEISNITEMLIDLMDRRLNDWLGEIYMMSGSNSGKLGQFFTPYNISLATAEIEMERVKDKKVIRLYEPSAGAGGMIIAAADVLNRNGFDYQKKLKVVAQDLDWLAVYMTYVQLSLYGIDAKVAQGDTLAEPDIDAIPRDRILYTPRRAGLII